MNTRRGGFEIERPKYGSRRDENSRSTNRFSSVDGSEITISLV
jgi:hypothetical protein